MRFWLVDAIRSLLASIRDDWRRDEQFSRRGLDVWLKTEPYRAALLRFYPATDERPAITPEANVIAFCRQIDIEPRLLIEQLGNDGQHHGSIDDL